jgi:hypothetical protein
MASVAENLGRIKEKIRAAALRVGRSPEAVKLLGVTKTVSVARVREGVTAGVEVLGENYVQEAREKVEALADLPVSWHFIGHLQSNKARVAAELFDCIQSLDRESLAKELDRQANRLGRVLPVLIQVNVGDEESKSGVGPDRLMDLFHRVRQMDGLAVRGLMALPPYLDDPEEVRPYFRSLKGLLERLRGESSRPEDLVELSMGMSHDFEVAVEEGATLVRIGTALFGVRPGAT